MCSSAGEPPFCLVSYLGPKQHDCLILFCSLSPCLPLLNNRGSFGRLALLPFVQGPLLFFPPLRRWSLFSVRGVFCSHSMISSYCILVIILFFSPGRQGFGMYVKATLSTSSFPLLTSSICMSSLQSEIVWNP